MIADLTDAIQMTKATKGIAFRQYLVQPIDAGNVLPA